MENIFSINFLINVYSEDLIFKSNKNKKEKA